MAGRRNRVARRALSRDAQATGLGTFDRRNRPAADELADETLNRVARTLEQGGVIATRPPARYCYIIAKFVLFEDLRRERRHVGLDETTMSADRRSFLADLTEDDALREQRLDCLDRCLELLEPEQRKLIVESYRDTGRQKIERRRALADRLGISMNALAIRASRIRDTLLTYMEGCRNARRRFRAPLSYQNKSRVIRTSMSPPHDQTTTTRSSYVTCSVCFPMRPGSASTRPASPTTRSRRACACRNGPD